MSAPPIQTDVLIIGAGPVGLFQVFQLGLQEISAHVIDSQNQVGGQCTGLYPDKFIYDIPGIKSITGQALVDQLLSQIAPFETPIHLGQLVQSVETLDKGFRVTTQTGNSFMARCVVIAAGVGAFVHKELPLADLKVLRNLQKQVFHTAPESQDIADHALVIYGGGETAVEAALEAALKRTQKGSVTLVYRRERLEIQAPLQARLDSAISAGHLVFKAAQITDLKTVNSHLTHLILTDTQGVQSSIGCDYLVESLGLSPKLGPLLDWGLELERKAVKVDTETFCTTTPGIYAVGDINTYAGKRKLILSGFHEATLAAYAIASRIRGQENIALEYTSASTRIHKLLGIQT